ncbi:MAG TPA: DUF1326 domain-containing protein [Gammaproteobacteria bacterium]
MIPWEIKAREFANCNCSYGCPCQFSALPTHGNCEAVVGMEIDEGHHGETDLAGVRFACILQWPGAVHEGRGKCQPIIDSRASEAQKEAVLKILSGEDTEPGKTVFQVYSTTYEHVFDPIVTDIDFEVDIDGRKAHIRVDGLIESSGTPIKNPVTGEEHRARIDLPEGFEYSLAEMGSGTSRTHGNIELDLKESYGQFAYIHLNNHGIVK